MVGLILVGVLFVAFAIAASKAPRALKLCNNGADDDGDGLVDYPSDPGCSTRRDNTETNSSLVCDNGQDETNDADSLADFRVSGGDPGCISTTDSSEIDGQCDDLGDNDGDGHTDLSDSECTEFSDNSESPRDFCTDTDGLDTTTQDLVSGEDNSTSFNYTDSCVSLSTVKEWTCGGLGAGYDPLSLNITCSAAQICNGGACVADLQPVANAFAVPTSGYAPLNVNFTGEVSGGNPPFTYFWNFTDGGTSTQHNPVHTFSGGIFNVLFRATDLYGDSDTDTVTITVNYCGDNIKNGPEVCDGTALNNQTCVTQRFNGGTLRCNSGCGSFDTSGCWDNTCFDSDFGIYILAAGNTSGNYQGGSYTNLDFCASNTTVVEYYCNGGLSLNINTTCVTNSTTTCSNGACV